MIVLDRLVRRDVVPAAWRTTALAWSVAVLAASPLSAFAQSAAPSSAASGAATASGVSATGSADAMPEHYAVQKGQSLLDVAGTLTHSSDRGTKQAMANALFAANPNAFYGNNPSRLKVGAVLVVPRPGETPAPATAVAANTGAPNTASAPSTAPASAALASAASNNTASASTAPASAAGTNAGAARTGAANGPSAASASAAASGTPSVMVSASAAHEASASVSQTATAAAAPNTAQPQATSSGSASSPATTPNGAAAASSTLAQGASAPVAAASAVDATVASAAQTGQASAATDASSAPAASGALAGTVASGASAAQAWTGSIRPAPAAPIAASAELGQSPSQSGAPAQNVSSLQQLLQLKNRVLAAMQAHGFGSSASTPAITGASQASGAVPASAARSATAGAQDSAPAGTLRGPLAVPAALAVLIVVALGIWVCLPARRRKPRRAAEDALDELPPRAEAHERDAGSGIAPAHDAVVPPRPEPAANTAGTAKSRLTAGPSERASTMEGKLPPDDDPIFDAASRDAPFGQPPFSFEEGAAGSLPTHDPQRGSFAESRTPFDTGLLLGLLEMHAHRRETERFQDTAHELWELTDGEGPDWARAASLGRRIDPDNPLYAEDPFAAYRQQHESASPERVKPMPDVDLNLHGEHAGDAGRAAGAVGEDAVPGAAADLPNQRDAADPRTGASASASQSGDGADSGSPSAAVRETFQPHGPVADEEDGLTLPEARRPDYVPVAEPRMGPAAGEPEIEAPYAADEIGHGTAGPVSVAGLGASRPLFSGDAIRTSALRDTQSEPVPPSRAQPGQANLGPAGFGALKLDFDLELTPNAAAPGSTPTSQDLAAIARNKLDLAIEYVELGDRSGARTLLTEVLATHDAATRERAQALLDTLK